MKEQQPEAPISESPVQASPPPTRREPPPPDSSVPTTGRRAALRDIGRQLTNEELKSSGVQKLLLDMLQESDDEREGLRSYVDRFHTADKTSAVLLEQVKTQTTIEIFFGVGVGLGGTIIGLAPFFWVTKSEYGVITACVGLILMIGSTIGRVVKT